MKYQPLVLLQTNLLIPSPVLCFTIKCYFSPGVTFPNWFITHQSKLALLACSHTSSFVPKLSGPLWLSCTLWLRMLYLCFWELASSMETQVLIPLSIFRFWKHSGKGSQKCFVVVQSLSHAWLFSTPWIAACEASLSFTISLSLLKHMSAESAMLSNHLNLCLLLLLLPSVFPSIRVFSSESALCTRWPKYWSFSFSTSPSNECSGLVSFRIDWLDILAVCWTLKSLLQKCFGRQHCWWSVWAYAFGCLCLVLPLTAGWSWKNLYNLSGPPLLHPKDGSNNRTQFIEFVVRIELYAVYKVLIIVLLAHREHSQNICYHHHFILCSLLCLDWSLL